MEKKSLSLQSRVENKEEEKEKHLEGRFKKRRGVNFGRIAFGLFFIALGVYFLAKNTGFLPAELEIKIDIWKLWPLLIVFAGLSMLSAKSKLSALIGSVITFIVLFGVGYLILANAEAIEKYSRPVKTTPILVEKIPAAEGILLDIETSGTTVSVGEGKGALLSGSFTSNLSNISSRSTSKDNWQIVNIATRNDLDIESFPTKYVNDLQLSINQGTPLQLKLQSNVTKAEFDLSKLQPTNLSFVSDASSIRTTFGIVPGEAFVKIDARTSNILLLIPRGVGVKITSAAELSLNNFEGLSKLVGEAEEKNIYQTKDFTIKSSKISINLTSILSSLRIEWLE